MGPYIGFMVGFLEMMEYTVYTASSFFSLGVMITYITDNDAKYEPVYWLAFYCTSIAIYCAGGSIFWRFMSGIALVTLLLIVVYLLASIQFLNFSNHVDMTYENNLVQHGNQNTNMHDFLQVLPLTTWFYIGVEALPLACGDVANVSVLL
jgi:amino acid permease